MFDMDKFCVVNDLESDHEKIDDLAEQYPLTSVVEASETTTNAKKHSKNRERLVIYGVDERPPFFQSLLLGLQHFLTFFGSGIAPPLILAGPLCMEQDQLAVSQLLSTAFFVEGIITFLQTTFGVRLPIVQGGNMGYLVPVFAYLNTRGECPVSLSVNASIEERGNYTEEWQTRMREVQGAIIVASCVHVLIGVTGLVGYLLKYIGPITITPLILLAATGVAAPLAERAGLHWGISGLTIVLIMIFSLFLNKYDIPLVWRIDGKWKVILRVPLFKLFPLALGLLISWFITYILTETNVFPSDPEVYGYHARTDLRTEAISKAPWFRVPYPGQWGVPIVTLGGVLGMLSAVVASVIESLGDYYALARLAGAPPPPPHAVNRGVGMEGLGTILAGLWGTGNGTASYSTNVGLVGLTKVASRFVIQICAIIMIIVGVLGKLTALVSSIPMPIVAGILCVLFGLLLAVGLSNLQYVDLNSSRNLVVIGFSIFMGVIVPSWAEENPHLYETGIVELDQVVSVLLTTGLFIGGFIAFVLDNAVPGTLEERGILSFTQEYCEEESNKANTISGMDIYDLPFGMKYLRRWKWTRYLPFSPTYKRQGIVSQQRSCFTRSKCKTRDDVESRTSN